jgi:integrase
MASTYPRGSKIWARFKNEDGEWACLATPFKLGDEDKALRFAVQLEKRCDATRECAEGIGLVPGERVTVARYAKKWIADRRALGLKSADDDETRLERHALPELGQLRLDEVGPRHIRSLVMELRRKNKLAPRSIRHVYATLATMFRTAVADELIIATPCVLQRGVLPKKVDADPAWRATAIFTREELEQLLSDHRIPEDRRVLYGLKGVAGERHTEAATMRWRQYDTSLEPLGALNLEHTKTEVPRRIPVHPVLARLLAEWRLSGWERTYGRAPEPDDLIIPTRNMTVRPAGDAQRAFLQDLETLGLRHRRGHDLRRTLVTLCQVDGARSDLLKTITHGPSGDIINVYSSFPWPALCAEIAKLKIELREGKLLEGDFGKACYSLATVRRTARKRWRKGATPTGFEPVFMA